MTGQRADARRNYARILAVAEAEVAERGADASLEHIARTAGVGSATVRRHFPNRRALLEAVFHERIEALRVRAEALTEAEDSRAGAAHVAARAGRVLGERARLRGHAHVRAPERHPEQLRHRAGGLRRPTAAPRPAGRRRRTRDHPARPADAGDRDRAGD
ncbi:LOW QUALITY PROTEIN: TetR family transcriptional regulator, partial [Streptomyces sp. SPB78]